MEGLAGRIIPDFEFQQSLNKSRRPRRIGQPQQRPRLVRSHGNVDESRQRDATAQGSQVADAAATPPMIAAPVRQGILRNMRERRAQAGYGAGLAENSDHLVDARAYCPAGQGNADGLR